MLRLVLKKGRIEEEAVELLERAGYDVSELRDKDRRLRFALGGAGIEVVLARADDVITYVEHGVCDMGIIGKDTIAECGKPLHEVLDLGFSKCRIAIAGPRGKGGGGYRAIATSFPNITRRYLIENGMDARVIRIDGSVELAPILGLSDAIVDLVSTGATLEQNGLEVYDEIMKSSARLIVNSASIKLKKAEVGEFINKLKDALSTT